MAKINHFRQILVFLPPQNRIFPPRCPLQKNSGAATDSGISIVSHQPVAASYPRRTNSLGNTTKWTLFWLAQPFLNTSSGKWANLLYHWSKRCDKRLFSSIFMITWLQINVAVVERRTRFLPASSLTYRNMPQNIPLIPLIFIISICER